MNLRQRALALLARREHSRLELARKLAAYAETDAVAALLDELEAQNLLSDVRYAEALRSARGGKYGSLRLRQELRDKGVDEEVIAAELSAAREDDLESAKAQWRKKFAAPAADAAERARQMRFLLGRGFPLDVVRRVVGGDDD